MLTFVLLNLELGQKGAGIPQVLQAELNLEVSGTKDLTETDNRPKP